MCSVVCILLNSRQQLMQKRNIKAQIKQASIDTCLALFSTLKTEIHRSSETCVNFYRLHDVISQKMVIFVVTAVKISNLLILILI
jgi:uncharacterized protein YutE (UPF0331/DUF86 family)